MLIILSLLCPVSSQHSRIGAFDYASGARLLLENSLRGFRKGTKLSAGFRFSPYYIRQLISLVVIFIFLFLMEPLIVEGKKSGGVQVLGPFLRVNLRAQ